MSEFINKTQVANRLDCLSPQGILGGSFTDGSGLFLEGNTCEF